MWSGVGVHVDECGGSRETLWAVDAMSMECCSIRFSLPLGWLLLLLDE